MHFAGWCGHVSPEGRLCPLAYLVSRVKLRGDSTRESRPALDFRLDALFLF